MHQKNLSIELLNKVLRDEIRRPLRELARETIESEKEHKKLGLTKAEMAFYNAVANSKNVQDFYTDVQLIKLTKELTETIFK